jgi:large subunit ribosomal protein L31e
MVENKNKMANKKTEKTSEVKIEREYTIPLRHRWNIVPTYKRANKAVKTIKEFLVRHMKIRDRDLDKIKLDKYLNETIWSRGIKHPPARIKVRAVKEGDIVRVEAVDMPQNIKFKKLRQEKLLNESKETAKKKKTEKVEEAPDKDKDGVEDKKEEKEDKTSTVEAGQELAKEEAKKAKHETKAQSSKEQKNLKSTYNRMSQGH